MPPPPPPAKSKTPIGSAPKRNHSSLVSGGRDGRNPKRGRVAFDDDSSEEPPKTKSRKDLRRNLGGDIVGARTNLVLQAAQAVEEVIRDQKLSKAERKLLLQYLSVPSGHIVCVGLPAQMIGQAAPKQATAKDKAKATKAKSTAKKTPKPNKSPYEAVLPQMATIKAQIAETNAQPNLGQEERRQIIQVLRTELRTLKSTCTGGKSA